MAFSIQPSFRKMFESEVTGTNSQKLSDAGVLAADNWTTYFGCYRLRLELRPPIDNRMGKVGTMQIPVREKLAAYQYLSQSL